MIPHEDSKWNSVRYYHDILTWNGTWDALNTALVKRIRVQQNRNPEPTAGSVESQTIKATEAAANEGSTDGKKLTVENGMYLSMLKEIVFLYAFSQQTFMIAKEHMICLKVFMSATQLFV